MLTVKHAYDFILKPQPKDAWNSFPWNCSIPPSHSMLVWSYIHNKIPTDDNMLVCGFLLPSMCSVCKTSQESANMCYSSVLLLLTCGVGCLASFTILVFKSWRTTIRFYVRAGLIKLRLWVWLILLVFSIKFRRPRNL